MDIGIFKESKHHNELSPKASSLVYEPIVQCFQPDAANESSKTNEIKERK